MVNYVRLAAVAKRLIETNGRTVTLYRRSTTPADPTKPWRGADEDDTETLDVIGAFVGDTDTDLGQLLALAGGTLTGRSGKVLLVAADSAPAEDLESFNGVLDGDVSWAIQSIETLAPGPVILMHQLRLQR